MRSFAILSLVATVAFSAFSTAAPLKADGSLVARAEVKVRDSETVNIVTREDKPSVPQILDGLVADLSPVIDKIAALTGTGDVVAALNPILGEVVDIVGGAVGNVDALAGSPIASILTTVDGALPVSVADVAQLTVQVLTLLSTILSSALGLVGGDLTKLGTIINTLNQLVLQLVVALIGSVNGLLSNLLPLISGLIPTLTSIGLTTLGSLLGTVGGLLGL